MTVWANASTGSTFAGFYGALTGTTTPQTLVMNANKAVTARFTLNGPYALSLTTSGSGAGTIQVSPSGPYYYGVSVTIWANVSVGSTFNGFTGSLTGSTTPQVLVMNGNKTIDAQFTLSSNPGPQTPPPTQNQKPVADLSEGKPYQGFVNTEITFDGSRSRDPDGNITKWFWVFGDNMNGTGKTVRHIYSKAGTYTVTLTVTDNKGATNIDTTTCVITQPNRPPTTPIILGPTNGTKNTMYTYTVLSTDADNDTIQYTIDCGDLVSRSSGFLPNATNYTVNHSWAAAGRYSVTVTVTDNQTESSAKMTVYIDAVKTGEIGYLLDNDSDGIYDAFYSDELKQTMTVQKKDGSYTIDSDRDGDLDYTYNETNGLTLYQKPLKTSGFEPVFLICIIIAAVICGIIVSVLLWKKLYI